MKDAVAARNAFAAGHTGYAMALKNTGAALSDYGHGEAEESFDHALRSQGPLDAAPPPPPPPPLDSLPPPPPPLPNFSPSPLKRATTMPEFAVPPRQNPIAREESVAIAEEDEDEANEEEEEEEDKMQNLRRPPRPRPRTSSTAVVPPVSSPVPPMPESKGMAWDYFFNVDHMPGPSLNDEEEINNENDESEGIGFGEMGNGLNGSGVMEVEPKTPEKVVETKVAEEEEESGVKEVGNMQIEHSSTAPAQFSRKVGKAVNGVSLMKVLNDIDDHFLKASESAQEVSKMLEATRLHYHSNFADDRSHIDHSARVMRVITWNKSFRGGIPNGDSGKDDLDTDEYETHATVLDKLLAWEKKLYEEVKQGEHMKLEYQKKVTLLNKQKKRGASAESLEKTKAAVSHLHTRYIVDMQSMDSTASEINHIRDGQLFPKLVQLVDGMAKMWERMYMHHNSQQSIVSDLMSLDSSHAPKETTKHHYDRTEQLHKFVLGWQSQFEKLVTHQKQYIQALNSWLKLNLIPIESSLKERISSPPRAQNPPIQALIVSWFDHLEKLPDELAKSAISAFAAVVNTIMVYQDEEMKLKDKCEETRREFLRKNQAFEDWYHKYMQRRGADETRTEDANHHDPVIERQAAVEILKKRLEEEVEAHQKLCIQVREKSLGNLKNRLPELFRAMSNYAQACAEAYENLRSVTQPRKSNRASS